MVTDLGRLQTLVEVTKRVLTPSEGDQVATYARTLSAIVAARRRREPGDGDLAGKSLEELAELAKGFPGLRELLGGE